MTIQPTQPNDDDAPTDAGVLAAMVDGFERMTLDEINRYAETLPETNELNDAWEKLILNALTRPASSDYQERYYEGEEWLLSPPELPDDLRALSSDELRELMHLRVSPEELRQLVHLRSRQRVLGVIRANIMQAAFDRNRV